MALNPPFDPRIKDLGFWSNKKLDRGYFISKSPTGTQGGGGTGGQIDGKRINFLYNPSVLSFSHQMNTDTLSPGVAPGGGSAPTLGIGTASFDLLYDRTYELAYGTGGKGLIGSPAVYGTSVDSEAIRAYVGIRPENPTGMNASKDFGVMLPVFTHFFFGNGASSSGALRFYGVISSLDIEVTHWTQKMVPQRCTASIQVTLMPFGGVSTPGPATGNGNTANPKNPFPKASPGKTDAPGDVAGRAGR